jgi:hypothetical protein
MGTTTAHRSNKVSKGAWRRWYSGQRQNDARQAAMERHAAAPDLQDLAGIGEVIGQAVDDDVPDATAQNDAKRHVDEQVVQIEKRRRC